jgi:anti-sigma regulatory factor (Ser/Thr protein kinase)
VAFTPHDVQSSVRVPHASASVAVARHTLAEDLADYGVAQPDRDDAVLVLSELVSNSVKHAAPLPGGDIRVGWMVAGDRLHLEIVDGGGSTRPRAGSASVSDVGGRGLDIVRAVSSQWGVTERNGSVTVWADVALTRLGTRRSGRAGG